MDDYVKLADLAERLGYTAKELRRFAYTCPIEILKIDGYMYVHSLDALGLVDWLNKHGMRSPDDFN